MSKRFIIQAIRNKVSMALLAFLLFQPVVYSQLTVSIAQQYQCENSVILIPVYVSDFNNVGSLQLNIEINTQELEFDAVMNPHISLNGGSLSSNFTEPDSEIFVTWSRITPVSISSGKLFDLKLVYKQGSPTLNFSNDCEIALADLTLVGNAIYNDGFVKPIEITTQPQGVTAIQDDPVNFSIIQNGVSTYQWQVNSGNGWNNLTNDQYYSGTDTDELIINSVPLDFDNHLFRCLIVLDNCYLTSDSAILLVTPLGINDSFEREPELNVYPNPCSDKLYYTINTPMSNISLELVNLLGKSVFNATNLELEEGRTGSIYTNDLQNGLYFLQLKRESVVLNTVKIIKQ
jgi:hypothetical protein